VVKVCGSGAGWISTYTWIGVFFYLFIFIFSSGLGHGGYKAYHLRFNECSVFSLRTKFLMSLLMSVRTLRSNKSIHFIEDFSPVITSFSPLSYRIYPAFSWIAY
jgi:hypothetical protein